MRDIEEWKAGREHTETADSGNRSTEPVKRVKQDPVTSPQTAARRSRRKRRRIKTNQIRKHIFSKKNGKAGFHPVRKIAGEAAHLTAGTAKDAVKEALRNQEEESEETKRLRQTKDTAGAMYALYKRRKQKKKIRKQRRSSKRMFSGESSGSGQNGSGAGADRQESYSDQNKMESAEQGNLAGKDKAESASSGDWAGKNKAESASSGDWAGKNKAESASSGDWAGKNKAESASSGDWAGKNKAESASRENRTGKKKSESGSSGNQTDGRKVESGSSGKQTDGRKAESGSSGNQTDKKKAESGSSGNQTDGRKAESDSSGNQPGKRKVESSSSGDLSGKSKPESGRCGNLTDRNRIESPDYGNYSTDTRTGSGRNRRSRQGNKTSEQTGKRHRSNNGSNTFSNTGNSSGSSISGSTGNKLTGSSTAGNQPGTPAGSAFRPDEKAKAYKEKLQKQQRKHFQKEYARAVRNGQSRREAARTAERYLRSRNSLRERASYRASQIAGEQKSFLFSLCILAVMLVILVNLVFSCGMAAQGLFADILAASYLSSPDELDAAEVMLTQKETQLQNRIDGIENERPGYDEYSYNLGTIGHNPFTLLNYLSAVYGDFTLLDVMEEIDSLFAQMYTLTLTDVTETRTRTVQKTDENGDPVTDDDGNVVTEEESYDVKILRVTLTTRSLESIVQARMTEEQKETCKLYEETKGMLQQFSTPVDYYWYLYVKSYYGYRKNPTTGQEEFHRGLDIAIPTGSNVYAGHTGTVSAAAYDDHYGNYVVIVDAKGYITKYAHMQSLQVSTGDPVRAGQIIGLSGSSGTSTGSELHLECMHGDSYYNPLLYFGTGTATLHGEAAEGTGSGTGGGSSGTGIPEGGSSVVPPGAYDDAQVQKLMEEATKYIGYPYVWGGSSPETSFDCSGFVCWSFRESGTYPLERTTAQGIYDKCIRISPSEAKAGDIIFFTGTYNSAGSVSHVGIYCGDGKMLHCGDPIQYASIHTSYWDSHFYAFGRLPGR